MICHPALKCKNQPSVQIKAMGANVSKIFTEIYATVTCFYVTIRDFSEHQMNLSILIAYRDIPLLVSKWKLFPFSFSIEIN